MYLESGIAGFTQFTTRLDLELACREARSYMGIMCNSGCMTACIPLGSRHYPVGSIGSKLYIARALHCLFQVPICAEIPISALGDGARAVSAFKSGH